MTGENGPGGGLCEATTSRPSAVGDLDRSWDQGVRWWDAAFTVIVVLSGIGVVTAGVQGTELVVALGCVAAILLAYAVLGQRAARSRDEGFAVVYLVVAILATTVVVAQDTLGTLLLFAVFTQIWMLLDRVWVSVVFCVLLAAGTTVAITLAEGSGEFDPEVLAQVAPQLAVALLFSLGLGLWVAHTLRQSEKHARLVDELHATQAELARTNHAAGVASERERIAQEIHDTLAQGFTSIVMLAQAASADLDREATSAARERLGLVEATARDNLAEARALVAASAPVALQSRTLTEALDRLAARFADESGVVVRASWGEVPPLSSAQEVVVLRSAQEALANVRRHADARSVDVAFGARDGQVFVEVSDDGRGLSTDVTEGYGLRGMRERVGAEGGEVTVSFGPGGAGTSVVVVLPVGGDVASPPGSVLPRKDGGA